MNFEALCEIFAGMTALNIGILTVWFVMFTLIHEPMYRLHTRWFHLSVEQFDSIHYTGMVYYKIAILLFNFVPFWVLYSLS